MFLLRLFLEEPPDPIGVTILFLLRVLLFFIEVVPIIGVVLIIGVVHIISKITHHQLLLLGDDNMILPWINWLCLVLLPSPWCLGLVISTVPIPYNQVSTSSVPFFGQSFASVLHPFLWCCVLHGYIRFFGVLC